MSIVTGTIPANAILDTQDTPVTFTGSHTQEAAQATVRHILDVLDYHMAAKGDAAAVYLTPDGRYEQKPLTIPERAIVAAFAAHFTKFAAGLERTVVARFPTVITAPNDGTDFADASSFQSEARAYQFAEVATHVFGMDSEVVETPSGDGWMVAVSSPGGISGNVFEQLRGVCAVLADYRVERAIDGTGPTRIPEDNQATVLAKLDAILDVLWQRQEPNEMTNIEDTIGVTSDQHGRPSRPMRTTKKAKRSA